MTLNEIVGSIGILAVMTTVTYMVITLGRHN